LNPAILSSTGGEKEFGFVHATDNEPVISKVFLYRKCLNDIIQPLFYLAITNTGQFKRLKALEYLKWNSGFGNDLYLRQNLLLPL